MKSIYVSILVTVLCALALGQPRGAGAWVLSATGVSKSVNSESREHTVTAIPAGSPTSCSIKLEGSIDGTTFFDLSGAQDCTASLMVHVTSKPIHFVRANLTAIGGGTTPSVTVQYLGVQ